MSRGDNPYQKEIRAIDRRARVARGSRHLGGGIDSRHASAPATDEGAAAPAPPEHAGGESTGRSDGERHYSDREIYRRVLREARRYWGNIVPIFLLTLLSTPLALLAPVPLAVAVDSVIGDKPLPGFLEGLVPESVAESSSALLIFVVCLLVGIELLSQLQGLLTKLLRSYTSERVTLRFRAKLFRHAQRLSMAYHDRKGSADANYRIHSDAAAISSVAVGGVIPFVSAAFTFTMMMVVIARIDRSLALIAIVVAPILAVLTWAYRRRLRARHREVKKLESSALGVVQEVLTSLRVVKAFGQEDREEDRFMARASEGTRARLRVAVVDASFWVAIGLVTTLGTGLVLFVGVKGVESGALTLGALLLVMSYLASLYSPLYTISSQVASLQSGFASAERVFALLDEQSDVIERPGALAIERASGGVEFRRVSFSYVPGQPVLEEVSFRVEPGSRVGIAGRTGSGKTTIVSLLNRFYDPTYGAVRLDGVDLRDYRLADLRDQFAIVLQEPVLFSTTIGENIAYGKAGATDEEIVAAAKAADVHDFIVSLPDGYDAFVGERGMTLSGGERQRISLARAFLKDAPILILDEPTSSVDHKTEATIIEAMERLMEGRTVFMIAHRLSTLEGCDVRLEMDAGRVRALEPTESLPRARPENGTARRRPEAATALRPEAATALRAWRELHGPRGSMDVVEALKTERNSRVFRLISMSDDTRVIAKWGRLTDIELERLVYERVLPGLPLPAAKYYGYLPDASGTHGWVFLEDIDGEPYKRDDDAHRVSAARYLAVLHGAPESVLSALPGRDPGYYFSCLRQGRQHIADSLSNPNPALTGDDRAALLRMIDMCDRVDAHSTGIEALCRSVPDGVVHGDFVAKNVRLVRSNGTVTLIPFDWETSGRGTPAPDLALFRGAGDPARDAYFETLRAYRPHVTPDDVARLHDAGVVLRLAVAVFWASQSLDHERMGREVRRMRKYHERLDDALTAATRHI